MTYSKNDKCSARLWLAAVSLVEFRVWFHEGFLRMDPKRFLAVKADCSETQPRSRPSQKSLRKILPVFELEDPHTVIWVTVKDKGEGGLALPFECITQVYSFDETGYRRLKVDLETTGVQIQPPLFLDFASNVWAERYLALHMRGGGALSQVLKVELPVNSQTLAPGLEQAVMSARSYEASQPLPTEFLAALFCYDRHVAVTPRIGAFIDFGIVLKSTLLEQKIISAFQMIGPRALGKLLIAEHATRSMEALVADPLVAVYMNWLESLGVLPIGVFSAVIFLDWKYRCQRNGGFDLALIQRSIGEMSPQIPVRWIQEAVFLTGTYWGFHSFSTDYYKCIKTFWEHPEIEHIKSLD